MPSTNATTVGDLCTELSSLIESAAESLWKPTSPASSSAFEAAPAIGMHITREKHLKLYATLVQLCGTNRQHLDKVYTQGLDAPIRAAVEANVLKPIQASLEQEGKSQDGVDAAFRILVRGYRSCVALGGLVKRLAGFFDQVKIEGKVNVGELPVVLLCDLVVQRHGQNVLCAGLERAATRLQVDFGNSVLSALTLRTDAASKEPLPAIAVPDGLKAAVSLGFSAAEQFAATAKLKKRRSSTLMTSASSSHSFPATVVHTSTTSPPVSVSVSPQPALDLLHLIEALVRSVKSSAEAFDAIFTRCDGDVPAVAIVAEARLDSVETLMAALAASRSETAFVGPMGRCVERCMIHARTTALSQPSIELFTQALVDGLGEVGRSVSGGTAPSTTKTSIVARYSKLLTAAKQSPVVAKTIYDQAKGLSTEVANIFTASMSVSSTTGQQQQQQGPQLTIRRLQEAADAYLAALLDSNAKCNDAFRACCAHDASAAAVAVQHAFESAMRAKLVVTSEQQASTSSNNQAVVVARFPVAEIVALWCDAKLKMLHKDRGAMDSGAAFDEWKPSLLAIGGLMTDVDLFAECCRDRLAHRLLQQRIEPSDTAAAERLVEVEMEFARATTAFVPTASFHRTMRMLSDVQHAAGTAEKEASERDTTAGLECVVAAVNSWPACSALAIEPPRSTGLPRLLEAFNRQYRAQHPSRSLRWVIQHGAAVLQIAFSQGTKIVHCSMMQGLLLVLADRWNVENGGAKPLTVDTLLGLMLSADKSAGAADDGGRREGAVGMLRAHLAAISANPKLRLLSVVPPGDSESSSGPLLAGRNIVTVNAQFQAKVRRLVVPLPTAPYRPLPESTTQQLCAPSIDSAIVRVLKSRRSLPFDELVVKVGQLLGKRFDVSTRQVKDRLEDLFRREYARRSADAMNVIEYVA